MSSYRLILLLLLIPFVFFSCDKRNCEDVICGPNQSCNNGICYCLDGYEGSDCQTQAYTKYVGNYLVNENCVPSSSSGSYYSYISWDGFQINRLTVSNFLNLGITVPAYIYTDPQNEGNIVEVQYSQGLLVDVYGIGTFDGNYIPPRIELELEYTQAGQLYQCVVTYYKQ